MAKLARIVLHLTGDQGIAVVATWDDDTEIITDHLTFDEAMGHTFALAIPTSRAGRGLYPGIRREDLARYAALTQEHDGACDRRNAAEHDSPEANAAADDVRRLYRAQCALRILGHPDGT